MVRRSAIEILGEKNVVIMEKAVMGAEDFSLFAEEVPGTLFRLGTGNAKKAQPRACILLPLTLTRDV